MMRLLFLCLLIPAARVSSEEIEGSAVEDSDDEDFSNTNVIQEPRIIVEDGNISSMADKTTGVANSSDQLTLIIIVVAVSVVALSVAVIIAIVLVRRRKHNQRQGIYTVPVEQGHKGAV